MMSKQLSIRLVFAFEWGRLGNQLFQYAAIKKSAPRAYIIYIGMDSLKNWIECFNLIKDSFFKEVLEKILMRLGRDRISALAGKGLLLSRITDSSENSNDHIAIEYGIITPIAVLSGFFQNEHTLNGICGRDLSINSSILVEAKRWIETQTLLPSCHHYFVHIRRGDYTSWPSEDAPAILSGSWYLAQIDRLVHHDPNAQFFVFSDDTVFVKKLFCGANNIFVSKGSEERDLAAMSLCSGGGILSASSFSWWGSYYSRAQNQNALFIAPRFWGGWRTKEWYPPKIKTSWIKYVDAF